MNSVIASSCKFVENGTSEKQVEAIKNQVSFHFCVDLHMNCIKYFLTMELIQTFLPLQPSSLNS